MSSRQSSEGWQRNGLMYDAPTTISLVANEPGTVSIASTASWLASGAESALQLLNITAHAQSTYYTLAEPPSPDSGRVSFLECNFPS